MPSPQMQEVINLLRQRRATPSSQPPQTYEEILGPYSLADQVNPLPADVSGSRGVISPSAPTLTSGCGKRTAQGSPGQRGRASACLRSFAESAPNSAR